MPKFTAEDLRHPRESQILNIRLEFAADCDGLVCSQYHEHGNGEPVPPPPHCHLVIQGEDPSTAPRVYAIPMGRHIDRPVPDGFSIDHDPVSGNVLFETRNPDLVMHWDPDFARQVALGIVEEAEKAADAQDEEEEEDSHFTPEEREALALRHCAEWRGQPDAALLTETLVRDFTPEQCEAAAMDRYEEWRRTQTPLDPQSVARSLAVMDTQAERTEHLVGVLRNAWLRGRPDFHAIAEPVTSSFTTEATMAERIERAFRSVWPKTRL
jgi:hypothetical protein